MIKFPLYSENRPLALALLLFSVLPLLFSSFLGGWILSNTTTVDVLVSRWGVWLILASSLTMAFGLTPTTFIALVSGFFMGITGVIPMVLAYSMASVIGYGIGHLLDGGHFLKSLTRYDVVSRVAEDLKHRPVSLIILVRLSPVLPFCLMNLALAALRVRLSAFLLAGAAGMLPRTLLSLWVGDRSRNLLDLLQNGGGLQEAIILAGVTVITVVLLVILITRAYASVEQRMNSSRS
ncbi:VTT domain-containing protein [Sansalvadorimonas sp. 2012CJ34-2]|uniref:TVP38/TMEM64 family membrane protein n=1 Tax=Parendozoicomonas callyspongiae TaxID=2942213 RepID=A0ABT0PCJ9_9GAMM|nr:VTT domain-containing protein [Sansalvadorimonas sp. 2012CJ34-2]MCL6269104.1 VTT domain-containing protein [Sansalvadorimonas sp. 2012CJ34-2]